MPDLMIARPPPGDRSAIEAHLARMRALPAEVGNRDDLIWDAEFALRLQDRSEALDRIGRPAR